MVYGNYITPQIAKKIPHLAVCDVLKTPVQKLAEVVMPISLFAETSGTVGGADG